MVIQANMPIATIVSIWPDTKPVFERHSIPPHQNIEIRELVSGHHLDQLLKELNQAIGSNDTTCIEGG